MKLGQKLLKGSKIIMYPHVVVSYATPSEL